MKILLIYPYFLERRLSEEDVEAPPIGLYYVGALLRENNYSCEILNWYNINRTPDLIKSALAEKKPDLIGISLFHANRWGAVEIARIAKEVDPSVTVVFGGIGATFLWKHLLTHFKEIDFCVLGEGEYPFLNLVRAVERGEITTLEKINGIAFRKDGSIVTTGPPVPVDDLDKLPIPAKYFTYQHVTSTRGCPGNCTFCGSPRFWGHRVRFHSPQYFVEQLTILNGKGVNFFYFSDDTFMLKKDRVKEICRLIVEKGLRISWAAISHVNFVDEETLYWMRIAGCTQISFGVESGSERIRRLLNKNISRDRIKRAFLLTTRHGILARAYFIYGCPGENRETIGETIELIHEIKPLGIIFYILDIFPGTSLYADFIRRTGATDDIWLNRIEDILYFETDPLLDRDSILGFGQKLRSEFHRGLPSFVEELNLIDRKELHEFHADFLSRLGMTFSHGDYSKVKEIKNSEKVAEGLFRRSLVYYPNHRAFLGLGIIRQRQGDFHGSVKVLTEGVRLFPEDEQLNLCLGISYMNLGRYERALERLLKVSQSRQSQPYIAECRRALGSKAG